MNNANATFTAPTPFSVRGLAIAVALLAPVAIFFGTMRSIVAIWNSSETFAHGYIILPIVLWLVWQRRHELAATPARPYWPALILIVICGFGWLLADLASVQVVQQYAVAAMLPLIVLAMAGPRVAWTIAFPLFFILLAVPFGEVFVDPLIQGTADFTVAALQLTGIPVLREGNNFVIPSGSWSVITACSGVRYLIASFTLGCLYAYLSYRSRLRQALFIGFSIIVPIVANWLRAYMIVMLGHLSGNKLATGVDHIIYGWLFFGLVMLLMFWMGSFWREDNADSAAAPARTAARRENSVSGGTMIGAACAVIVSLAMWPVYSTFIDRAVHNPEVASFSDFHARWQEESPFTHWKPIYFPANAELTKTFRNGDQQVGIGVRYYRNQDRDSMLISSNNRMTPEEGSEWRNLGVAGRAETIGNATLPVRETRIGGPDGRMVVWTWYWIDGRFTTNDYLGKLLQAKTKLLLNGDDGAAIILWAPYHDNPDTARAALRAFLDDHLGTLDAVLISNAKGRAKVALNEPRKEAHVRSE